VTWLSGRKVERIRHTRAPRAAVRVELIARDTLEVGPLLIAKEGLGLAPIPEKVVVVAPDGKEIKPSKGAVFLISVETFDPFHLVTEMDEDEARCL
jgi:hypothetical protein